MNGNIITIRACFVFILLVGVTAAYGQTPNILATSPAQNGLNQPIDTDISVIFDIDMDAGTINSSTFVVNARSTGLHRGIYIYDGPTKTVVFTPNDNFEVGDVVTVVITSDIRSQTGTPLGIYYSWSFTVEVGGGFGNFAPQILYPVDDHPSSIVAADFNNDRHIDLAITNRNANCVSILNNTGTGLFSQRIDYQTGQSPHSIISVDFNEDGYIDIATVNGESEDVSILLNNGYGSFASQVNYQVGVNPQELVAADLNGDGNIDLAVANMGTLSLPEPGVSILFNNGDGSLSAHLFYPLDDMPVSMCGADLDGDGDIDLATVSPESHNLSVLFNDGLGAFVLDSVYPTHNSPNGIQAADLDSDGDLDLAISNGNFAHRVSILLNSGDGSFAPYYSYPAGDDENGEQPFCIFIADLDGDNDLDIVTGNVTSLDVSVLLNNGIGEFASFLNFQAGYGVYSVFMADFDSDGDLDLATANYGSGDVSVLLNHMICGDANRDG